MQSRFLFLMLLLVIAGAASAQQLALPKKSLDTVNAKGWLARATASHTTRNGKVYIMPIDHMRCLAPDMKKVEPMPGIRPVAPEKMPNGFRSTPGKRE